MSIGLMLLQLWEFLIISYFLLHHSFYLFLLSVGWFKVRFFLKLKPFIDYDFVYQSPYLPPVTLLVPAYNEEQTVCDTLRSIQNLKYPQLEIIVINDGSTDATLSEVIKHFEFAPQEIPYTPHFPTSRVRGFYQSTVVSDTQPFKMTLVDKENGGKGDALNCGLNAASSPYICCIDADSLLDENALLEIMQPIMENPDKILASGGQVGIANGCKAKKGRILEVNLPDKPIEMFQLVEYMRAFTLGRVGMSTFNTLLILSGVFAVFRFDILREIGGFLSIRGSSRIMREYSGVHHTVAEDLEVVIRLHRYIYEKNLEGVISFLPYPIIWSQVPTTLKDLGKQRNRWYRGAAEALFYHKKMLFNRRFGKIGFISLPYLLLFEFLGPILELLGYITIPLFYFVGILDLDFLLLFLAVAFVYGIFINILSVVISFWSEGQIMGEKMFSSLFRYRGGKNILRLLMYAALSMVGYRQIELFFKVQGLFDLICGKRAWVKFEHKKF